MHTIERGPVLTRLPLGWFAPPELADPELRDCARRLWLVSWPFLGVVAVVLSVAVLFEPATAARRATTIAAVTLLVTLLHALSRSGRPVLASWLLVLGLSVLVTQRAWNDGGVHAPIPVFYALFIVMAGALLGTRAALVTAAACVLGAGTLALGTAQGWLERIPGAGSVMGGFVFILLSIGLALVVVALLNRRPRPSVDAVQMLVHDMRSPMQLLLAHLELVRDDVREEGRHDIEGAIRGAQALDRMTASLLDASRLEAGRMPLQRASTDVAALTHAVVDGMRVLQPSRTMTVEHSGDTTCDCDAELMRRVVENLVGNALKHTPVNGDVAIRTLGMATTVVLSVADQGPGIPVADRPGIFDAFTSGAPRNAAQLKSFGVGLAFCRLAVQAHGGTIRVEERPGGGSVFVVELPRRPDAR